MKKEFIFKLERSQSNKISKEEIIKELENVAYSHNYFDFKQEDFNKLANIHYYTVIREFGSWEKAMLFLKKHLKLKGIDFKITSRRRAYTQKEIFEEMERMWRKIGHRPSENEWTSSDPKISYDTVYRKFGGWTKACVKFIEFKSGNGTVESDYTNKSANSFQKKKNGRYKLTKSSSVEIAGTRTIPLNLRVKILSRDNFRCVYCGKSPATDLGVRLHIDHIIPFSRGGQNTEDNLQTLCESCNLGKAIIVLFR